MAKITVETFGIGGYDPKAKNGNLVSVEELDMPDFVPDAQVVALQRAKQLLGNATTIDDLKVALEAAIDGVAPEKAAEIAKTDVASVEPDKG